MALDIRGQIIDMLVIVGNPIRARPEKSAAGFVFIGYGMHLRSNYPSAGIGRLVDHNAIKAFAFNDHGIVVAKVDDPRLDAFERQFLLNLGEKLFGRQAA